MQLSLVLSKLFFCVSFRFIQRLLSDPSLSVEKQSEMVHDFYGVSLNLTGKLSTRFFLEVCILKYRLLVVCFPA